MRIRRVHIEGFGCLRDRAFEFGEGLTLVVGPNEAGKTTFVRAIGAILFGQQADARRTNEPWDGDAYAGVIELVGDEGTVRIRREFDSDLVELTETADGGSSTWRGEAKQAGRGADLDEYRERLRRLIGFDDEELFLHTLCVRQLGLETDVSQEVRKRLTGPSEADAEEIKRRLGDRYEEVSNDRMRKGAKPRQIELVEQEIAEAKARLEATRGYFDELRGLREQEGELSGRLKALETEQANDRRVFADIDALAEAHEQQARLAREVPELDRERERLRAHSDEEKRLSADIASGYPGWDAVPDDYGSKLLELARRRDDVGRTRDEVERLEREARASGGGGRWTWLFVPLAVLAAAYFVGQQLGQLLLFIIGGVAASAALFVVLLVVQIARARRHARHARELAAAAERYEENQATLKVLSSQLQPFMTSDDPDAEQKRYDQYRQIAERLGRVRSALESSRDLSEIEHEYYDKNAALGRAEQKLKELTDANPALRRYLDESDPLRERARLREEIDTRARTIDEVKTQRTQVAADLRALTRRQVTNESALTDEIAALEERRDALERRRAALGLAIDVLAETITEYQAVHRESLAGAIGELFARLTGGRYERVRLDERFVPSLDGLGRQGLDVKQISQGARDQLYFAVRVAVAQELSGQVRLPFVLDDPFATFDDARLAAAYDVLQELAREHQFIVLTHNPRERQYAAQCLELG